MRTTSKIVCVLTGCAALAAAAWYAFPASRPIPTTGSALDAGPGAAAAEAARRPRTTASLESVAVPASAERIAQDPAIRGRILDATTGLPLAGRTVELRRRTGAIEALSAAHRLATGGFTNGPVLQLATGGFTSRSVLQPNTYQWQRASQVLELGLVHVVQAQQRARAEADPSTPELEAAQALGELAPGDPAPQSEHELPPPIAEEEGLTAVAVGIGTGPGGVPEAQPSSVTYTVRAPTVESTPDEHAALLRFQLAVQTEAADQAALQVESGRTAFQVLAERIALQTSTGELPFFIDGGATLRVGLMTEMTEVATRRFVEFQLDPGGHVVPALVASTTTGTDGRFRFDCPEAEDVFLELVPGEHDWIEDTSYVFVHPETRCSEDVEWRIDVAAGSRVRGHLVDARTQAPLGDITLELAGIRDWVETVTTDEEGRFATTTIFPAGHLAYTVHDGSDEHRIAVEPREARVEPAGAAELELRAAIGPTWRLRFVHEALQDGSSKRILVMQEHDPEGVEVRLVGCEPWPGWEGSGNPFAEWRGVTGSAPAWVRYPVIPKIPRGGPRAEFRSSDLAWAGSAALSDAADGQEIALARTARIEGRIELAEGESVSGLRVSACRAGGGAHAVYDFAFCGEDGSFTLDGLDTRVVRALELRTGDELVRRLELALEPEETRAVVFAR